MIDTDTDTKTVQDIAADLWMEVSDLEEIMQAFTKKDGDCLIWTGQKDRRGYA